jgi:thiol:disulfide interchange protein/DsbC/DsbD-like thiol-disulfide interchange protein
MRLPFAALLVALAALFAAPVQAQIDSRPKVQARLIAERATVTPGATVTVALEQAIRPGWHTYWINPGEAGQATQLAWKLPPGWRAGELQWPYPMRVQVGPIMDYGYEGKVWILSDLHVPASAQPGQTILLKATVSVLVCKEVCIPEDANVQLPLHIAQAVSPPAPALVSAFAAARAKLPQPAPWPVRYRATQTLDLFVAAPSLSSARPVAADFYPLEEGMLKGIAPPHLGFAPEGLVLRTLPGHKFTWREFRASRPTLSGVLVLRSADGSVSALSVQAPPGSVPETDFNSSDSGSGQSGLVTAVLFALLGGLILNLMPCVLPVLAMKALALASTAGGDRREASREGFAYGVGAILTFVALGLAIVILRAGGQAIGWGFQLQEPLAVAVFALLIFAVGLNLSGVYEITSGVTAGDSLTRRGGMTGAFFTGVLAVAVAAPCTAPFMAAALGYALAQPALAAVLIFAALGFGFALPFVAIGLWPQALRFIPKPGPWMVRSRQLLAFPMYAAAVWLVWVLAEESGASASAALLSAMVLLALAAWAWQAGRLATTRWRGVASAVAAIALIAALGTLWLVRTEPQVSQTQRSARATGLASEPYSPARLQALQQSGRPVFLDATAAWCITCLVNEKVAFSDPDVRRVFAQKRIAYLVADWTNRNGQITALLQAHGRSGVPLYLYYRPGAAEPVILPQVLTPHAVFAAVGFPQQ